MIHLLGTFQVLRDGQPVTGFESDKVRALLAYLVEEVEQPQRRELLAGLLWPNMPERQAKRNLRRALMNLRDAIGDRRTTPPFLRISRTKIQFNPLCKFKLDTRNFLQTWQQPDCLNDIPALQAAAALYQGDFLAGFSIADSVGFEEWLLQKRSDLRRRAWEAHHTLANYAAQHGHVTQALHHARRQIALEPLHEASHRQMMRYLTFIDRHNEAIAHYQSLRNALLAELNVRPDEKTQQLYEKIRTRKPIVK
jgi:DNA-binding SARP family transcriptional activator